MMRLLPVSCFVVSFSYWTCQMSAVSFQVFRFDSMCERQKTLRTRRERSGAPHASLVYNRVVAWVVWKNLWFFRMVLRHDWLCLVFWRYLFVGIALTVWPRTWPVGSYHCVARYWLHGNGQCLKRKRISVTTYIQVCLASDVCLQ